MDLRWAAYIGSGVLAAVSLVPVAVSRDEGQPPAASPTPGRTSSEVQTLLRDVERHTARLRDHAAATPVPRRPARDPFRFALRPRRDDVGNPAGNAFVEPAGMPAIAAPEPALTLVGMAERLEGDQLRRLAVLAGFGDVHLVAAGDRIADRFVVRAVEAGSVELDDEREGCRIRLTLERAP